MQTELYPKKIQAAIKALFTTPGQCALELRQAIEAYAANLVDSKRPTLPLPPTLAPYVAKVTLYAYRIPDDDVLQLKEAGFSEDEIFEITLCASVGASLVRMERGLMALKGDPDAAANS